VFIFIDDIDVLLGMTAGLGLFFDRYEEPLDEQVSRAWSMWMTRARISRLVVSSQQSVQCSPVIATKKLRRSNQQNETRQLTSQAPSTDSQVPAGTPPPQLQHAATINQQTHPQSQTKQKTSQ
jgi:hypothetical protein